MSKSRQMKSSGSVELAGRTVHYSLHYSGKAKRLSLRISPDAGLVFVVPKKWNGALIDYGALLKRKAEWVLRKLDHVNQFKRSVSFAHGSRLPLLGKHITVVLISTSRKRATVKLVGETLEIQTPITDDGHVRVLVVAWYKYIAKNIIPQRVEHLNASLGFEYRRIVVRDQKSRWGSCSRQRTLSFNWRLLLVPSNVMDYLIYHELAHLQEMNHSVRFWRLVREMNPAFLEAEHWLKKNGQAMFW